MVTVRWPPRRLAPIAVRPSLASARTTLAADRRRSKSVPPRPSSLMRAVVPGVPVGGQQLHRGHVGRKIERVGGERALQRLPPVGGEGEHALRAVAVEFDIDVVEADGAAGHVGLGLDGEVAEAAAGQRLLPGPGERVAQGGGVAGEGAFDLERRLEADRLPSKAAFIGLPATRSLSPVRLPASAAAKSASVTLMSSGSSCQTKRPVAPKLLEIDGQASESMTSSKVSFSFAPGVVQHHRAVADAHFGEGGDPLRVRLLAARQRIDQPGPVGARRSAPGRPRWSGRSSETSAISTRPTSSGKKRSRAVSRSAVSAGRSASPSSTSSKLTLPVGNRRDRGGAAQRGVEPGDGADLVQRLGAHGRRARSDSWQRSARRRRARPRRAGLFPGV